METCLKLAVNIQASCKDDINPEKEVGELVVCLLAHLWYLQEEFTNVLVAGKFGDTTQGIFHQLQQNTSAFTPSTIENIKSAIALSTAQHQPQTAQSQAEYGRNHGRGFGDQFEFRDRFGDRRFGFRGHGRGGSLGSYCSLNNNGMFPNIILYLPWYYR